ncbi:hypothetical protein JY651_29500 [Pyxidicoccus parkwayensis]|uniref:Transglycosylase SLT domain-containing protein n=1 Tax=Pyxidicoccus parkwayensis TaxID=2813578 RepID=A0ABX7NPJ7_9BACT|nr:hypothetical protein [Pyxidicoccus parkwaysis]QSQ19447.1 hypothetical protein JY651_29500 [Pyxidicoccus parkwaysis]
MNAEHFVCRWALLTLALGLGACQPTEDTPEADTALAEQSQSQISATVMRQRSDLIKAVLAAEPRVDNPLLWAGIANTETGMAFCYGELSPYECPGPYSSDCNGPIVAGYWDGACSARAGGLGMFQFDYPGTYDDTLRVYGTGILTVQGSITRAVQYVIDMAWNSPYTPYFPTWQDNYNWLNNIRVGGPSWDLWLGVLARHYNGKEWGTSEWAAVKAKYDAGTRAMLNLYGESYWYGTTPPPPPGTTCSPEGGLFCGNNGVPGDSNTLYVCKGGVPVVKQVCANGCNRAPAGQSDSCLSGSNPPKTCSCANGAYKNGNPIPQSLTYCGFRTCGSDNNLYECTTTNQWVNTGVACGGSCSCANGAHLNGTLINAADTSCHMEVCGGSNTFYECLGTSWSAVSGSYCRMN